MGARAARFEVERARRAGLSVMGVIDTFQNDQAVSTMAQLHPSGTVTLIRVNSGGAASGDIGSEASLDKKVIE